MSKQNSNQKVEQDVLASIARGLFTGEGFGGYTVKAKASFNAQDKLEKAGVVAYSSKAGAYVFAGKLAACNFIAKQLGKGSVSQSECLRRYRATGKSISDGHWNLCYRAVKDALQAELKARDEEAA